LHENSLSNDSLWAIELFSKMFLFGLMFVKYVGHFMCTLKLLSDEEVINWNSRVFTFDWCSYLIFKGSKLNLGLDSWDQCRSWLFFVISVLESLLFMNEVTAFINSNLQQLLIIKQMVPKDFWLERFVSSYRVQF